MRTIHALAIVLYVPTAIAAAIATVPLSITGNTTPVAFSPSELAGPSLLLPVHGSKNNKCKYFNEAHHCKGKLLRGNADCVCIKPKHKHKHKNKTAS
jgi:hypothetical protein